MPSESQGTIQSDSLTVGGDVINIQPSPAASGTPAGKLDELGEKLEANPWIIILLGAGLVALIYFTRKKS